MERTGREGNGIACILRYMSPARVGIGQSCSMTPFDFICSTSRSPSFWSVTSQISSVVEGRTRQLLEPLCEIQSGFVNFPIVYDDRVLHIDEVVEYPTLVFDTAMPPIHHGNSKQIAAQNTPRTFTFSPLNHISHFVALNVACLIGFFESGFKNRLGTVFVSVDLKADFVEHDVDL